MSGVNNIKMKTEPNDPVSWGDEQIVASESSNGFGLSGSCAHLANQKLQELIDAAPVVYGCANAAGWFTAATKDKTNASYMARLMFIEKLKKEPCKHEPEHFRTRQTIEGERIYVCKHCNAELVADWKTK